MKKKVITIVLLLLSSICYSQYTLWSASTGSGWYGKGKIFSIDRNTGQYQLQYSFGKIEGDSPGRTRLAIAEDGKIYGLLKNNRSYGINVIIFEFDPLLYKFKELTKYNEYVPGHIETCVCFGPDGKLYGNSAYGGDNFKGMVYSYEISSDSIQEIHLFSGATQNDGERPMGDLLLASDNNIYGTTNKGGSGSGCIYRINTDNDSYTKLADFNPTVGKSPEGGLTEVSNGVFYGMTREGGANNCGTIYKFDATNNTIQNIFDLDDTYGKNPVSSLCNYNDTILLGMTPEGGMNDLGVLFKFNIIYNTYHKVLDFNGYVRGANPTGSLTLSNNGHVYGFTSNGGNENYGGIFQYDIENDSYSLVHNFDYEYGRNPYGSFSIADDGSLYGTTSRGGVSNFSGFLISLDLSTHEVEHHVAFESNPQGERPHTCLIDGFDGRFYGVTHQGGKYDKGVFFGFDPQTKQYEVIEHMYAGDDYHNTYNFTHTEDGKILGICSHNGTGEAGLIFKYDPLSDDLKFLAEFDEFAIGKAPTGQLVQAVNGKFYGRVHCGGPHSSGGIYTFDLETRELDCVYPFYGGTSYYAENYNMVPFGDDALIGIRRITSCGNDPTSIFKYTISTNEVQTLLDLTHIADHDFFSNLLMGSNGKIYGTTYYGGQYDKGYIYEFDPISYEMDIKYNFYNAEPYIQYAKSELMMASNGMIYGMYWTTSWTGIFYSLEPVSETFTIIDSLSLGGYGGSLNQMKFLEIINVGIEEDIEPSDVTIYPNPGKDKIYIKNTPEGEYNIMITDITGRILINNKTHIKQQSIDLDISGLPTGMYILSLRSSNYNISRKIIKAN